MNLKRGRIAALAAALIAVPMSAACGGGNPSVEAAQHTLAAPSGPGSFVGGSDERGRAYIAQMRSVQKAGSSNPNLAALSDEQLLALGKSTCTAKEQGATNEQIEKAVSEGMSGVSDSDVTPYVETAIAALCSTT
jgi:hypothetical protein